MAPARKSSDLQLQKRDLQLLRGLFEPRVMKVAHIATLDFDGNKEGVFGSQKVNPTPTCPTSASRLRLVFTAAVASPRRRCTTLALTVQFPNDPEIHVNGIDKLTPADRKPKRSPG
jgi:hypothetical protein